VRDEKAALKATGGDRELSTELIGTLVAGLPDDLSELDGLLAAADWSGIDAAVHRMRGATAYCGVPALDRALCELSLAAKSAERDRILSAACIVATEARRLRQALSPRVTRV
jgi:two-component system sensor histidine kinase BarA